MIRSRNAVAVTAGLVLAVAVAACGIGPGEDVGGVELTITRDYGATSSLQETVSDVRESDTVMRVLDRSADIDTRYGGKFVQSIDGTAGGQEGGRPHDWFFYVNGVESETGASDYSVAGGDRIWWDYRDWGSAQAVPAVVGAFPEPFIHGYAGHGSPTVSISCKPDAPLACEEATKKLREAGVAVTRVDGDIRVLVGSWVDVRSDPAARAIEKGPQSSGVFAEFRRTSGILYSLEALDQTGKPVRNLGTDAGLVAATRRYGGPPTWVVTGGTPEAARKAATLLDADDLRDHYALAIDAESFVSLPASAP